MKDCAHSLTDIMCYDTSGKGLTPVVSVQ